MILITMAGKSSRFYQAGYRIPKYALEYRGQSIFEWSTKTFESKFSSEKFVFVIRNDDFSFSFVKDKINKLEIKNYDIVVIDKDTRGQAESAYIALKQYHDDFPVTIFNIDTIRYNYSEPNFYNECDGYLEVFEGDGEQWSFIEPLSNFNVGRTAEKDRISKYCSNGLYYFKSQLMFQSIFESMQEKNEMSKGEFYIAPMYNYLIQNGLTIKYFYVSIADMAFCGTPAEYEELISKEN